MERLTEPYGTDHLCVCGNKTVYNRNPKKSSRVAFALAKLFQMEELAEPKKVVRIDGFYGGLACHHAERYLNQNVACIVHIAGRRLIGKLILTKKCILMRTGAHRKEAEACHDQRRTEKSMCGRTSVWIRSNWNG